LRVLISAEPEWRFPAFGRISESIAAKQHAKVTKCRVVMVRHDVIHRMSHVPSRSRRLVVAAVGLAPTVPSPARAQRRPDSTALA
jgi:hypothetical protein